MSHVSFSIFSFSSHTVDDPSINTAAVFQAKSQLAQKLFCFMKDCASSLVNNIKILQTESSVEYMK